MADDCVFCRIVAGELPAQVVDEDEHTIAFMDINPWTRGHAVVVPRSHSKNLYEIPQEDLERTMLAAKRLALRMKERLGCDGVNLLNSCEPAAWQTVFHFHIHVIPRYEDDPLRLPGRPQEVTREELAAVAALDLWKPPPTVEELLRLALRLPSPEPTAVCHGDLHFRQLLVDRGRLSGMIDWVDVCRSDPGIDLAVLWSFLPPEGRGEFLDAYGPVAESSLLRGRVLALFLGAVLARYGRLEGKAATEAEAVASLERAAAV